MSFKPRYIKAQEAEERIVALWRKEKGTYADTFNTAIDACQTVILDMYDNSSQDVVSVVRCKDCIHKYYDENQIICQKLYWCDGNNFEPSAEDFCSQGERREDERK